MVSTYWPTWVILGVHFYIIETKKEEKAIAYNGMKWLIRHLSNPILLIIAAHEWFEDSVVHITT